MLHREGLAGGPPLIFYHGVGGGAWSWKPQVAALADRYDCFLWEARGHGAAPRVADAGLGDYWIDAQEALDAVRARTSGRVGVIGHSMGGLLAVALAAISPDRIGRLALIDPVYPDHSKASGHDFGPFKPVALAVIKPLIASFMKDGPVSRAISRWMFSSSFTNKAAMDAAWPDQRTQVPVEYPKMLLEAFGQPEGFPVEPFAERIDVPSILFNGRSPVLAETLARRLGARYVDVRLSGGHYLQLDCANAVNERLVRFLGETDGP
jgi:pimeloyl-ACP methyl ester carboxylesterase